jgi:hypothetical protein
MSFLVTDPNLAAALQKALSGGKWCVAVFRPESKAETGVLLDRVTSDAFPKHLKDECLTVLRKNLKK